MARIKKSTQKKVVRAAKRHPRAVIALAVILVVIIAVGAVLYLKVDSVHTAVDALIAKFTATNETENSGSKPADNTTPTFATYGDDDLSFHFLELGNNYTGDCTYIKAGDIDILIDAGSRQESATVIAKYVDHYCTDGTLEYVIATHAHQDHIAGFVGTSTTAGIFERYECGVIIDFVRSDLSLTTKTGGASLYAKYLTARDKEVEEDGAKHFTALQCYNETDGAQRTYSLGEGMSMTVLYQRFYEEKASDENDYSVCVLFTHGSKHYLFTGDLEEAGEASLVASNTLPKVELFKAGHHGSKTSSTDALLSVIQPEIVCVCCCAGSTENNALPENRFPTQAFVTRIAPYTDRVYVTTVVAVVYDEKEKKNVEKGVSMNGNITVLSSHEGTVTVTCSNNSTKLKDTDWFKANRTCPAAWSG